jgi:hypothetical protein
VLKSTIARKLDVLRSSSDFSSEPPPANQTHPGVIVGPLGSPRCCGPSFKGASPTSVTGTVVIFVLLVLPDAFGRPWSGVELHVGVVKQC